MERDSRDRHLLELAWNRLGDRPSPRLWDLFSRIRESPPLLDSVMEVPLPDEYFVRELERAQAWGASPAYMAPIHNQRAKAAGRRMAYVDRWFARFQ